MARHLLVSLFLTILFEEISSYNLADKLPIFKYGTEESKFGFSVALHKTADNDNLSDSKTLLVAGAPTARKGPRSSRTGGVFYCPMTTNPNDCRGVNIAEEDEVVPGVMSVEDDQWMGVSLKSQGPGKNLVTCAHRFKQINMEGYGTIEEFSSVRMCGKCVLMKANAFGEVEEISGSSYLGEPCKDKPVKSTWISKKYYGYSQAGISIALVNDDEYVLGAPGTYSWTGAVFDVTNETLRRTPTCHYGLKERTNLPNGRQQCLKIPVTVDSYMGFSVVTSNAIDTTRTTYYVVGAPRGNETGAILFFTKDSRGNLIPDRTKSLIGDKISSSFGFSIAVTDINGDGLDDVIVGVPQYFERSSTRKVDGAIYVYLNEAGKNFSSVVPQKYYGALHSFFGHSVTALGDIDRDGFKDVAVGAPYEDGSGVIHVFRGGSNSLKKSQTIKGSQYIPFLGSDSRNILGFGSSLSAALDADNNDYPDLLIGTSSDTIVLLRSRPVVSLDVDLKIKSSEVDLKKKSCSAVGVAYTCFEISFCFSYTPRTSNSFPNGIRVKYTLVLDNGKQEKERRVHFRSPEGSSIVTNLTTIRSPGVEKCLEGRPFVYVDKRIKDKLTPIELKYEFDIDTPEEIMPKAGEPITDLSLYPILDGDSDRANTSIIPIKNSCGDDGCTSDLRVNANMPKEIILGRDEELPLTIEVSNQGEDAHQATVDIFLPANVGFLSHSAQDDPANATDCIWSGESSYIRCDLGNPFTSGSNVTIDIVLSTLSISQKTKNIVVSIKSSTTSQNPEIKPLALSAGVVVEVDLELSKSGTPEQVRYKETEVKGESGMKSVEDIGPALKYTFTIKNKGLQTSGEIDLIVDVPAEIYNGKWLLYLVSAEVEAGRGRTAGSCNSTYVNTLGLEVRSISSRQKRSDADDDSVATSEPKAQFYRGGRGLMTTVTFSCKNGDARCIPLECSLDDIEPGVTTAVTLQLQMWEATLLEEYKDYDLVFVDTAARLTSKDSRVRFKGENTKGTLKTTVDHEAFESETVSSFPWWYILIALVILVIFYIGIIFCLMKFGFFKRKRFNREHDETSDASDEKKVEE